MKHCTECDSDADLKVLGGLEPVFGHLTAEKLEPEVDQRLGLRAAAAHVIGTAASNNIKFQQQLLDTFPDAFFVLVQVGS